MTIVKTQDPKYVVNLFWTTNPENKERMVQKAELLNNTTREAIPEDEPIIIFRAKDKHALHALRNYRDACMNSKNIRSIERVIEAFENFANNQPHKMREPT